MEENLKQLLLKDLCARLPYGVTMNVTEPGEDNVNFNCFLGPDIIKEILSETGHFKYIPYLRPMSSMTEEERNEWTSLMRKEYREAYPNSAIDTSYYEYFPTPESFDYLIENMFDYRGLIPKGLAIEALEGMYNNNVKNSND